MRILRDYYLAFSNSPMHGLETRLVGNHLKFGDNSSFVSLAVLSLSIIRFSIKQPSRLDDLGGWMDGRSWRNFGHSYNWNVRIFLFLPAYTLLLGIF